MKKVNDAKKSTGSTNNKREQSQKYPIWRIDGCCIDGQKYQLCKAKICTLNPLLCLVFVRFPSNMDKKQWRGGVCG